MKQHITPEQLNELSEKGMKKLKKWWKPKMGDKFSARLVNVTDINNMPGDELFRFVYVMTEVNETDDNENRKFVPLLSIGQLIEFLGDSQIHNFHPLDRCVEAPNSTGWHVVMGKEYGGVTHEKDQLCDALWEAVKEILEK